MCLKDNYYDDTLEAVKLKVAKLSMLAACSFFFLPLNTASVSLKVHNGGRYS